MAKTKMIRIPKRGGGTRLQKVKVLASGKYRFMKNPTSKRTRKTSKSKPKRRSVRRTARRKRRSRRKGMTIPLAIVTPIAANLVDAYQTAGGDLMGTVDQLAQRYAGWSPQYGWQFGRLQQGLGSLIVGALVHKFVGGPPLNVNRMLAAAGVPFIRI